MRIAEAREIGQLARLGVRELVRMAESGRLDRPSIWMALRAAECFRRSIRESGLAAPGEQTARLSECRDCPSVIVGDRGRLTSYRVASCGAFGVDRTSSVRSPTCGCVVAMVDSNGEWVAAGKTVIARGASITVEGRSVRCSADCPQGRFSEDQGNDQGRDLDA